MSHRRWVIAAAIAAGALVLTAVQATQSTLQGAIDGRSHSWIAAFASVLPQWIILAALAPAVDAMVRRFPIVAPNLVRNAAIHAMAALVVSLVMVVFVAAYISRIYHEPLRTAGNIAIYYLIWYAVVYGAIAGVSHALRWREEGEARRRSAEEMARLLTRTRLDALRARLNPHFLFNTLNAISTMALQNRGDDIVRALGLLGDLLRTTLDDALPQEVPLRQELEWTDRYLDIQRIRFGQRLSVRHEVDPSLLDTLVPSMILQPIVENAVIHGMAATADGMSVTLRAERSAGKLLLTVSDDGVGPAPAASEGFGLGATRERLHALFGDSFRLILDASPRGGTRVSMELPARESA